MPARTYSTDVYLTCPCPGCEGRKVRITLRKFRSLSRLPLPFCEQVVHQLASDATTGNSKAKPGSSNRSANTRPEPRLPMIEPESRARRIDLADGAIGILGI